MNDKEKEFNGGVVGVSFKPYYQKEYDFLNEQDNKSRFICELIKQYMKNNEQENDQK